MTSVNMYDYVIILCASPLNKNNKFDELSGDGSYLGGQVRMQAAVDFYHAKKVKKFIVVGGGINESEEKKKWRKVTDMRNFLVENRIPQENIIRICSFPDTHGNMKAIYETFKSHLKGKRVGLLTNFYHLPRAMRFTQDFQFKWGNRFVPIAAEAIITSAPPTYLQYVNELLCRIFGDIKGLKEWEKGEYRDQQGKKVGKQGEIHDEDLRNI